MAIVLHIICFLVLSYTMVSVSASSSSNLNASGCEMKENTRLHLCFSVDGSDTFADEDWTRVQEYIFGVLSDPKIQAAIDVGGDPETRGSVSSVVWQAPIFEGRSESSCGSNCQVKVYNTIDKDISEVIDSVNEQPPPHSFTPLTVGGYECSRQLEKISEQRNYSGSDIQPIYVNLILSDGVCNIKCGNPCMNPNGCSCTDSLCPAAAQVPTGFGDSFPLPCVSRYCTVVTDSESDGYCSDLSRSCSTSLGSRFSVGLNYLSGTWLASEPLSPVCECQDGVQCDDCTPIEEYNTTLRGQHILPRNVHDDFAGISLTTIPVNMFGTNNADKSEFMLSQLSSAGIVFSADSDDISGLPNKTVDSIQCL
mmetsp:Transcript_9022/g.10361  ORF Transcript_9022/g.10361 Transcript_9022/m.10361 type:complete len:366 (+) Transcript_9022:361-1458(+)